MESDSLPITLMHPVFVEFVDNCQHVMVDKESGAFVHALRQSMVQEEYESEKQMAKAARNIFMEYLAIDLMIVTIKGSESNGSCRVNGHLIVNLEIQTQQGRGREGCDPSLQNLAHFIKQLPDVIDGQLPCLLLDLSGPLFGIYGAMSTDDKHIICEPLCPILPLHGDVENCHIGPALSRVCMALRVATERLTALANNMLDDDRRLLSAFPYKTSAQLVDGTIVKFHYLKRVTRNVFLVQCTGGADGFVYNAIAKFAKRYGKDAHEYCASKGFAPALLAYEQILANWSFILMENVAIESISKMDRSRKKTQLQRILRDLRLGNFVHGDLRHPNVGWNPSHDKVILIDFDWSGRNGQDRYPSDMNPEIAWPSGASAGNFLSFDDDSFWIKQLLPE